MITKHTPTLWHFAPSQTGGTIGYYITNGDHTAVIIYAGDTDATKACGRAIIKACNAHDELVAALESLDRAGLLTGRSPSLGDATEADHAKAAARAALAKGTP